MDDNKIKTLRNFLSWTFIRGAISLIIIGVLARVVIPDCINARDDMLTGVAVVGMIVVPVVALWFLVSFFIDIRKFYNNFNS